MLFLPSIAARFHAFYNGSELIVSIAPPRILQGDAPHRVRDMVLEWARLHQQELQGAWARLQAANPPLPIAPLE